MSYMPFIGPRAPNNPMGGQIFPHYNRGSQRQDSSPQQQKTGKSPMQNKGPNNTANKNITKDPITANKNAESIKVKPEQKDNNPTNSEKNEQKGNFKKKNDNPIKPLVGPFPMNPMAQNTVIKSEKHTPGKNQSMQQSMKNHTPEDKDLNMPLQNFNAQHRQFDDRYNEQSPNNYNRNRNMNNRGPPVSEGFNNYNDGPNRMGGMNSYGKGPKGFYGHDKIKDKLRYNLSAPLIDLPPLDNSEKKFNPYSKLFVGNLPKNTTQEELKGVFDQYGEIGQVYLNKDSSFAFITFDFKSNAAKAQRETDNKPLRNRPMKVRFATINEGIRVKNLSSLISNELLEKTFSIFGVIDSCRVIVDERGVSKGEGVIIFHDKKSAVTAVKKCQEECFFLSGAMRPAIVMPLEPGDDSEEGLPESSLPKNNDYHQERSVAPHFADEGSFEFNFGSQWKHLFSVYEEKKQALQHDFKIEMERLEKKMMLAKVECETEQLRKELAAREAETAQLRRHFGEEGDSRSQFSGFGGNFESFNSGKRSLDQSFDGSFNYDGQYGPDYDRGYRSGSGADYERNYDGSYDRPYGSDFGPEDFNRSRFDGAASNEGPPTNVSGDRMSGSFNQPSMQEKPFDHSERSPFNQAYDRQQPPQGDPSFKGLSKRPRY